MTSGKLRAEKFGSGDYTKNLLYPAIPEKEIEGKL
jgi:hypothetical protein